MARRRPFNPDAMAVTGTRPASAPAPGLFDTGHARLSAAEPPAAVPITVTQLVRRIKSTLNEHLPATIHLIGEIGDLSRPGSGHVYMTLKDAECSIQAVMWKSAASKVKFDLHDGLEVVAVGTVDVYEPGGRVQFYIRRIHPRGTGALELAFRQLYEKLKREGLFEPERKRPLPPYPQRIGLVTSPTGAAVRDILHTLARRFAPVEIILFPVRVQGEGAAGEIARAIDEFNRWAKRLGGIDILIVGRGGGSLEDLWAFNEETVARAVAGSGIPVISAVGHEIDVTICDLAADVRAPTPTAAAQLAVPDRTEIENQLAALHAAIRRAARHSIELAAARLARLQQDTLFRRPELLVYRAAQRLDESTARLRTAPAERLASWRRGLQADAGSLAGIRPDRMLARGRRSLAQLEHRLRRAPVERLVVLERHVSKWHQVLARSGPAPTLHRTDESLRQLHLRLRRAALQQPERLRRRLVELAERLDASSHRSVLRRGFSLTRQAISGKIIRHPEEVRHGDPIRTQLRDGEIHSRVEDRQDSQRNSDE